MIIASNDCNALLKSIFKRGDANKVMIGRPNDIFEKLQIDPRSLPNTIDAFVVSSIDMNRRKIDAQFQAALERKHPDAKVIYVCKARREDGFFGNPNIDEYLVKPKADDVAEAIYRMAAKLSEKPTIQSSSEEAAQLSPRENKIDMKAILAEEEAATAEPEEKEKEDIVDIKPEDLSTATEPEPVQDTKPADKEPELVTRMKRAQSVADVANLMRETNAETLLKDLAKDNANYSILENKLHALREDIANVMVDGSINMEQRLSKVRTIMYNKKYFTTQTNTIIEQYVSEIIESLTSNTIGLLDERLHQIDESIKLSARYGNGAQNFGRLTGINEERANIIMDLNTLKQEVQEIGVKAVDTLHDITSEVAAKNQELTGNNIIDNNIKAHGSFIVDGDVIETLRNILLCADSSTDLFKTAVQKITAMIEAYNKLVSLDKEQIAATNEMVKYLKAHNIDDTVIANTLLKKSLRVFTGIEGSGRSIVPYILSQRKSKENCNVLLIDLTGTCKYEDYGIKSYDIADYKVNRYENDFVVVTGTCTSVESAQNLTAILTRAADFYRVINIVLPTDNKDVFDVIAHDVRVINYLTTTKRRSMEAIKEFMDNTSYENVGQRVIVNDTSATLTELSQYFGLLDRIDIGIISIPHIKQIELCSLNGLDPTTIDAVNEAFAEVSKYC